MKKVFALLVLFLSWSEICFAFTQQQIIDKYLSDRKLDLIEGIWQSKIIGYNGAPQVIAYYKDGNFYTAYVLTDRRKSAMRATKGSQTYYYGTSETVYDNNTRLKADIVINIDEYSGTLTMTDSQGVWNYRLNRIWPSNINSYNAKFEKKEKDKKKKKKKTLGASGTAFFITDKGHLITNNHVIEVCNNNSKIVVDGKDIPAKVLAKDALLDLALLKVDLKKTKFIHLSKDPPKKLQRIIAAGYPLGKSLSDDLKFTSGIISSLKGLNDDSTLIQIDAALNKGNSGGPIIDEKSGELVAVAVAGLDKSQTEAVNFGIKTNSVKNFLDANQLDIPIPSFFNFGVDAAAILEKSTVYTYCKNE